MPAQNLSSTPRSRQRLRAGLVALALPAAMITGAGSAAAAVSGNVFQDLNSNGVRDAGGLNSGADTPVAGVTVRAFTSTGRRIGPVTTDAEGNYSLNVPRNKVVRVEFSGLPDGLAPGFVGDGAGPAVQIAKEPAGDVNFAVNRPGDYCQDNPTLATNCFVYGKQFGDGQFADDGALVSFAYGATGSDTPTKLAKARDIGTTWGLAWDRNRSRLYSAAYAKRHTGFGPNGTGAIYSTDTASGTTSLLFDANTIAPNHAGADPHPTSASLAAGTGVNTWHHDVNAFTAVGKIAFGDIDVADDGSTLFAVNLASRELIEIPLGDTIDPASVRRTAIPVPAGVPTGDARPFAVSYHRGTVYVGLVNSAETSQDAADLHAYVYGFTPGGAFSGPVLDFPLDYSRACAVVFQCSSGDTAEWTPWASAFTIGEPSFNPGFDPRWKPQPMLTDIEFAPDGSMLLGLRDRFGDQIGNFQGTDDVNDSTTLLQVTPVGDVLRAAPLSAGGWGLESNGASPAGASASFTSGGGADTGHGPGGGEFYFQESLAGAFDDTSLGGLAQVPGFGSVAQTQNDPQDVRQAGATTLSHSDGTTATRYTVFQGPAGDPPPLNGSLGKASGLGDLEALCAAAPIQIGNRVWLDKDRDGKQDAGESGIGGVAVRLYDGEGTLLATTRTVAGGLYYFAASNVPGGIQPGTRYTIRVPLKQKKLKKYALTKANVGSHDGRDSDGRASGPFGVAIVTTGGAGQNNHTHDFGFVLGNTRLAIDKRAAGTASSGENLIYTMEVKNTGTNTAQNVVVRDRLPQGLALIRQTTSQVAIRHSSTSYDPVTRLVTVTTRPGAQRFTKRRGRSKIRLARTGSNVRYTNANGTLTFRLGSIAPGRTKSITLRVRVLANTRGARINRARAAAANAPRVSDVARTEIRGVDIATLPAVTG